MASVPVPRIFCISATAAPILAVVRRGPSAWTHIGRWDVEHEVYELGAWTRARVYPERCDLSPDGRWFAYFTLRGTVQADWDAGETFIAISRLPWLKALAAWSTCGTWTRGVHFVDDRREWELGDADVGDAASCRKKYGMKVTAPLAFVCEHRRGWEEAADSPPRSARGAWDEQVDGLTMFKARPGRDADVALTARGYYAAFRSKLPAEEFEYQYQLKVGAEDAELSNVQWADWDARGRLLVATSDGRLQIRAGDRVPRTIIWETDLSVLQPDPQPPPADAARW